MSKASLAPNAQAAILVLAGTDSKILYKKNENKSLSIASITKLMSMLVLLEGIDNGEIAWTDMVVVSPQAASIYGSKINLKANEKLSVEDMFKSMAIASANDAAIALAEHYSGSMSSFADRMNEKARELGLRNSHFSNSHGVYEENNYSSARDVAKMAINALKRKEIIKYSRLKNDYIKKEKDQIIALKNTNRLIGVMPEVDGLKTGHNYLAGYCLVATALKGDVRLIAVVLGEPNKALREKEVSRMLSYGFKTCIR